MIDQKIMLIKEQERLPKISSWGLTTMDLVTDNLWLAFALDFNAVSDVLNCLVGNGAMRWCFQRSASEIKSVFAGQLKLSMKQSSVHGGKERERERERKRESQKTKVGSYCKGSKEGKA